MQQWHFVLGAKSLMEFTYISGDYSPNQRYNVLEVLGGQSGLAWGPIIPSSGHVLVIENGFPTPVAYSAKISSRPNSNSGEERILDMTITGELPTISITAPTGDIDQFGQPEYVTLSVLVKPA